nr:uncharacterized protein LOC102399710 [Bubalus bubalis]
MGRPSSPLRQEDIRNSQYLQHIRHPEVVILMPACFSFVFGSVCVRVRPDGVLLAAAWDHSEDLPVGLLILVPKGGRSSRSLYHLLSEGEERRLREGTRAQGWCFLQLGGGGVEERGARVGTRFRDHPANSQLRPRLQPGVGERRAPPSSPPPQPMDPGPWAPSRGCFPARRGQGRRAVTTRGRKRRDNTRGGKRQAAIALLLRTGARSG